jgi:hypothetical protein
MLPPKGTGKGGAGVGKRCWKCAARGKVEFAAGHTCPHEHKEWDEVLKKKARVFIQKQQK